MLPIPGEWLSDRIKREFPEEYAAAEKLYEAETDKLYANGYNGDFGCGFEFALNTYGPMCWWHLFKGPSAQKILMLAWYPGCGLTFDPVPGK